MTITQILLDDSARLRSGWRFAIFCVAFFIAASFIAGSGYAILYSLGFPLEPETPNFFIANAVLILIPALLVGWLCGKYLEALPFRALGASFTRGWFRNLMAGLLIGAITLTLAVLIAFLFGGLRFDVNPIDGALLFQSLGISLLVCALGAAWEEVLFRGYILQTFARSGLAAMAIAITAMFFGAIHAGNPSVSTLAVVNTMLAGIWFGVAYLKTRDLWFVWGMHLIWNWMQGAVFGIEVSGITTLAPAPLLREIDTGPVWLTGESYGVEGGVVTTMALIVSTIAIHFLPFLKPSDEMRAMSEPPENSPPSEGGVAAASVDVPSSPPSEGGVAAASADGVVNQPRG